MTAWPWRLGATLLALPSIVHAQEDCFPPDDANESRTFAILSAPLTFTGAGGTHRSGIGIELSSIPNVPDELATPTTCRPGKGPENTDPVDGIARLRVGLAAGDWYLEGGWIPPVRVGGMRSNLIGIAISHALSIRTGWRLTSRVHALIGRVRGPITCNANAIEDPVSECFEGTISNDRWDPNILGIEATLAHPVGRFIPHAGLGWTSLRPRFQVGFTNSLGGVDRRRVEVDLQRVAVFGGMSVRTGRLSLTGEGYFTFGDRLAVRIVARMPLGGGRDATTS